MTAKDYDWRDVVGWYASEKLDGVRAVWDGSKLMTKTGKEIFAPEWFTMMLPSYALDGELWMGRGTLEAVAAMVRRKTAIDAEWRKVKFCIFDLPNDDAGFLWRMFILGEIIAWSASVSIVAQHKITDEGMMHRMLNEITANGGEGIMLRQENEGRPDTLLRLKTRQHDEGICIAKGAESVTLEWRGARFNLTTRKAEIGDRVTFSYLGLTSKGIPREAGFAAVRDYE